MLTAAVPATNFLPGETSSFGISRRVRGRARVGSRFPGWRADFGHRAFPRAVSSGREDFRNGAGRGYFRVVGCARGGAGTACIVAMRQYGRIRDASKGGGPVGVRAAVGSSVLGNSG